MKTDGEKIGISIPLLPKSDLDKEMAQEVRFIKSHDLTLFEKKRKLAIKASSIFGKTQDSEAVKRAKIDILAKRRKVT
jgi:hypothetical protein